MGQVFVAQLRETLYINVRNNMYLSMTMRNNLVYIYSCGLQLYPSLYVPVTELVHYATR